MNNTEETDFRRVVFYSRLTRKRFYRLRVINMLSFIQMTKAEKSLYEKIYDMVKRIPKGKVATYGQIARLCGIPEHSRLIGYALHNLKPNSGVPWHRVINSKGMISLPRSGGDYDRQKKILEKEGVQFIRDKIDLSKYGAASLLSETMRKMTEK